MYQLAGNYIKRLKDNAFIPQVESNQDYKKYLLWKDGREETQDSTDEEGNIIKGLSALESHEPEPEDSSQYELNRRSEYPSISDQLDMIYHDIEDWRSEIKKVKEVS